MKVLVSVNDGVKVRLTQEGMKRFLRRGGSIMEPDKDRYITMPLWELMNVFGPDIVGQMQEPFFENNELIMEGKE